MTFLHRNERKIIKFTNSLFKLGAPEFLSSSKSGISSKIFEKVRSSIKKAFTLHRVLKTKNMHVFPFDG